MKLNRSIIIAFVLMIVVCSLYRVMPRPFGFAPQIAMTIFCGLMIKDRKWAFALPIVSMFLSDCLYQVLYLQGMTSIKGFYGGMFENYLLFGSLTILPMIFRKTTMPNVAALSLVSPTVFFLISNLLVWLSGTGLGHPQNFNGLMLTYADGLPFYGNSILATIVFSAVFFGAYYLLRRMFVKTAVA